MYIKKKKSQNEKMNYKTLYASFVIQIKIFMDDEMVHINQSFQYVVIILSSFQQLSFAFENYFFQNTEHSGFKHFFLNISKFTRPYVMLPKNFGIFSFIIPLILLFLYETIIFYIFICFTRFKKQKRMQEIILEQNRFVQILLRIYSYKQALLYYLIFIPQLELITSSILYYSQEENLNLVALPISFISFILIILNMMFYLSCILQSNHIKVRNLNMLSQSFNHYLNPIYSILIVCLNKFEGKDQQLRFYLIVVILLLRSSFNIYSIFVTLQNIYRRNIIDLFSNCFQFSMSLILLFIQLSQFKSQQKDYETALILIIIPIATMVPIILYTNLHFSIILNSNQTLISSLMLYKIATIIDQFGDVKHSYLHDNCKITQIIYFKQTHIQYCSTPKCLCTQQQLTFEQIINLYLKDQVNYFNLTINKLKQQSSKQLYFLHYLSLIHYLGLSTRAFQQSNIIAYQESDNFSSSQFSKVLVGKPMSQKAGSSNSLDQQNSSAQKSKVDSKPDEMVHIKIQNMGFINKQRLLLMQELIKKTMSTGLGKQTNQLMSDNLEHAVKLFLKSEENNKKLKNKILKMINKKKDFFVNLTLLNQNFNLFNSAKQMIMKLTQLEDELLKLYFQFPSRKMQALNTFYQSEVMNNYFQAFKLATVTSISDEKLFKMQSQISFDMFSSKLDYIIVGFDEKSHKLQIRQYSNLIHEFFGYNQEKFKQVKTIDHLLPSNFDPIHQKLVQHFLSSGYSKFFRVINQNYCRYQQKFIKSIEFFFDINVSNLEDLTFVCFFQNKDNTNAYMFCCNNNKIQSISKNFVNKIGYPVRLITTLMEALNKQPLSKVFPKLQMAIEMNATKFSYDNDEFEQDVMDQSEYQIHMILPEIDCLLKNQKYNWDIESNCQQFVVDAVFHYRKLKQDTVNNYVIVEIREAKRYLKSFSTPQQTENITPTPGASQTQFQDNIEDFDEMEFYDQDEYYPNIPRALEFDQKENQNQQMNLEQDQSESEIQFGRRAILNLKNQSQSFYPNVSLVSPKDVGQKLIDAKFVEGGLYENNSRRNQDARQQFFSAVDQKDVSSNAEEESHDDENEIKNENKIDKLQMEDIDQELQENIKMQMQLEEQDQNVVQIDDIGSQVSSVAAFKKSKYSKKYDLIQKLIISEKFSKNYYLARTFFTALFILFIVFSIVQMIFSSEDLNRFLQELDMVQIKSNIIAPIDNYIVAQNAVMNYAILNMFGMMNQSTANLKLEYAKNDITYNYEDLKSSYIKQLSNQYLNPFFQDKNFTIMQSEQTTTSTRNVSAREAIYLSLEAAYQFVLLDYLNIFTSLDTTSGFFVYLFGNYQTFYDQLTLVNQDMLTYSVQRSVTVKEKWLSLMIPILIIGFLLLLIVIKFHNLYLQQYDQFIQLFSMLEMVWIQRDIDRYKGITTLVIKDSDVLFKYQFDIDLKEKFLAAEDIRKEKIAQNQKAHKQKQKATSLKIDQTTTKIPSLVIYSTLYTLCFGLCFISTSIGESYFTKYPDTTYFFNNLCDVSIASTGVFSLRQIIYVVSNKDQQQVFFFLKNQTYFIEVFFDHINTINEFLALMSQFDPSQLITSDAFVDKIDELMQGDVCQFLPEYKIESAQIHCDAVYDGVVRRGFQLALNTVRNELLNEFKNSYNFSVQQYSLNEQLEIGLINYDAVSNIKLQFQDELVHFTQNLINQIMIINICAIIFYLISIGLMYKVITLMYYQEFRMVLKFVLLMPQTSLFLDGQLDRTLKQIIIKHNLT